MATFVDAHGSRGHGYPRVNLDLVAKLRPITGAHGHLVYACENANGETVATIDPSDVPFPGAVVPDTRGTILIGFYRWTDGATPVYVSRFPVVAWRITGDTAHPVITDTLPDVYCLEHTTGPTTVWVFPSDSDFDTFDDALRHATEALGLPVSPEAAHA